MVTGDNLPEKRALPPTADPLMNSRRFIALGALQIVPMNLEYEAGHKRPSWSVLGMARDNQVKRSDGE